MLLGPQHNGHNILGHRMAQHMIESNDSCVPRQVDSLQTICRNELLENYMCLPKLMTPHQLKSLKLATPEGMLWSIPRTHIRKGKQVVMGIDLNNGKMVRTDFTILFEQMLDKEHPLLYSCLTQIRTMRIRNVDEMFWCFLREAFYQGYEGKSSDWIAFLSDNDQATIVIANLEGLVHATQYDVLQAIIQKPLTDGYKEAISIVATGSNVRRRITDHRNLRLIEILINSGKFNYSLVGAALFVV